MTEPSAGDRPIAAHAAEGRQHPVQRALPVTLPRFPLAHLPTPLHDARCLARAIGVDRLLVKRDDLTGFGAGGNKVRKLEFLIGEALALGADTLIAVGGPQSNAVRTAMIAARAAGLDPIAVFYGSPPAERDGNLLLESLVGTRFVFTGDPDRGSVEPAADALAAELRGAGQRPCVLARGAATPVGDAGYVEATAELEAQLAEKDARPEVLVVANGSGGTHAGLLAGAAWIHATYRVVGILVSRSRADMAPRVLGLAQGTADLLRLGVTIDAADVHLEDGYIGGGYGAPTTECGAAIRLALETEGLVLDPVYTGKAMAGLVGLVRRGEIARDATVVFVHTGGEPGLYARHADYAEGARPA